jgi:hypothetical protein
MLRFSLFVASVMAASTSTAGGVSPCPVDTVPIQVVNEVRSGPETALSVANISDQHFRAFVTAVTEHVAARLAKDNLCLDNSKKRSLLQFVNWPLIPTRDDPPAPVPSLDARPSGGCRISSPWLDLAFERMPVPSIRGIVRWNQRQLLADQAVLAGARNVPPGVAIPLMNREAGGFIGAYEDSELLHEPAAKPIEERVPPDLLWLLRRSWQSTRGPFVGYVTGSMRKATEKGAEGYTNLVIALIDRCFASNGADINYSSILDVADLISLEQYKIDTPIR